MKNPMVSLMKLLRSIAGGSLTAAFLAACGGGSAAGPQLPQVSSGSRTTPSSRSCATTRCIYVANYAYRQSSVFAYPANANGNVAPVATLHSDSYLQYVFGGLALDTNRNLYVTGSGTNADGVIVYAPGANGDPTPAATISGGDTQLNGERGLALDDSGKIYVVNTESPSINVYPAGANGDVAPIAVIYGNNTQDYDPVALAVGPNGLVYVVSYQGGNRTDPAILVFAKGADGNVAPIRTISGANTGLLNYATYGLALDGHQNLYVSEDNGGPSGAGGILVFGTRASGNVAPIRSIGGSDTGLNAPLALAIQKKNLYVANNGSFGSLSPSITVYPDTANADAAPLQTITDSASPMTGPIAIAVR